jgi:DnaJ-domain-containing protein 1
MGDDCNPKLIVSGGSFSTEILIATYDEDKDGLKAALKSSLTDAAQAVLGTEDPKVTVVQSCEGCGESRDLLTAVLDAKALAAFRKRHKDMEDAAVAEGIAGILADRVMHMLFCRTLIFVVFG